MTYQAKDRDVRAISELADTYGSEFILGALLTAMEGDEVRQYLERLEPWIQEQKDLGAL